MFTKGKSGNKQGRPRKTIDSPEAFRTEIHSFLVGQLPQIKRDWKKLRERDRVLLFERLARYVIPGPDFDLSKLTEADLDLLIKRIQSKLNKEK